MTDEAQDGALPSPQEMREQREGKPPEGPPQGTENWTEEDAQKFLDSARKAAGIADFPTEPTAEDSIPEWATVPANLSPPPGVTMGFLRFKAEWTRVPSKGDRVCIVWSLTDLDERLAFSRVRDNFQTAVNEMAKQMIRAVDGVKVDWNAKSGEPGNLEDFWRDIGPKCRSKVVQYYNRTHMMTAAETADFLESCVVVRTVG